MQFLNKIIISVKLSRNFPSQFPFSHVSTAFLSWWDLSPFSVPAQAPSQAILCLSPQETQQKRERNKWLKLLQILLRQRCVPQGWFHQLRPQPSSSVWTWAWPVTALGGEKSELGRKCGEGKAPWKWQGLLAFFGFSWPHWAVSAACLDIQPQGNAWGVSLSVTLCGFTAPFCEPLTSPSFGDFLPWLLIVSLHFCWNISSLRCAKPLITCLHVHALAETPSKGSNNKDLFICLLFFCLF